jgi:ribosomal protein S18 acetylase RimI-like enzyme
MTIRIATHSDAASMAAISIEVWIGTYLKRGVSAFFAQYALEAFTSDKMSALISDSSQFILVSENVEGIDGFFRITPRSPAPVEGCSDTEIATFYVQPRHHGKGIGKRLLNAALKHCSEQGVDSVWLATNAENSPAIAFYLSQGFEQVGETEFRIQDEGYLNNFYSYKLSAFAR